MSQRESVMQRSFAAGELAPALHARADTAKYTQGARTCRNFFVRREGGVSNRAGFRFVGECDSALAGTRLMRYVAASGSGYLIEAGAGYFRFFFEGAEVAVAGVPAYNIATDYVPGDLVAEAGVNYYCIADSTGDTPPNAAFWHALTGTTYEIPTPYALATLPDWSQSGNVITLTHPSHAPMELIFVSATRWVLQAISTLPTIAVPTTVAGVAGAAGALPYSYIVTAAALDTYEESNASAAAAVPCATPTPAAPNALTWDTDPLVAEWYVYCDPYGNGVYGYVGTATSNAFKDSGQTPDFNLTPPVMASLFASSNNYPAHAANFQQRRVFANTNNAPDGIFASKVGLRSNFGVSSPLQDDDAVTFRVAGNNQHAIGHMVTLPAALILLTVGGEWTVTGGGGPRTPITPSSIQADQELYVGVDLTVRPVVVGNSILYVQARGNIVRDAQFNQQVEGLGGRDLTIFATHLLERKTVVAMDYQQSHSIVWCVRSDGELLGLTYIPEQEVWGWHRHDTDGDFEDVCVVPEDEEDVVYVIVKRTLGTVAHRYIERLERRELLDGYVNATSFFVDSGLSYSGAPADTFAGLDHLEGEVVAVLADGNVLSDGNPSAADLTRYTVTSGTIYLTDEYANVHIGLPIPAHDLETLDLDVQGSDVRDKQKAVPAVTVLVERSARGFWAGPDETHLVQYTPQTWEGTATLNTDALEINIPATFNKKGRVFIRHTDPLPLTVLGVLPNVEVGG